MTDIPDLIERIDRHEGDYKRTGFIGVYDHVLLKELIEAAQALRDLQAVADAARKIAPLLRGDPLIDGPVLWQEDIDLRDALAKLDKHD